MTKDLTRLTVNLIRPAVDSLDDLARVTGLGKTDIVNRALQIYAFVEKTKAEGGILCVREPDGHLTSVTIL
jgi:hypothetical protein